MKKTITLTLGLMTMTTANAQLNLTFLDENNVSTLISDGGLYFNNPATNFHGYEIPAGSGKHIIYAMSYWIGAQDGNGSLHLAAHEYNALEDFFHGPLTDDGVATPDNSGNWNPGLFEVTSAEIQDHMANYATPGYVVPNSIATWPAHGDTGLNFDFYLAPFVDANQNGIYDPENGDYPCIRGDRAVYTIINDKGGVHQSGGDPLGVEVHSMYYQYDTSDERNNTTFGHVRVINRSSQTYLNSKMSLFLDTDIGFYGDDYFGSDSTRNLMYAYNADAFDETQGGVTGYDANPPAAGIVRLDGNLFNAGLQEWTLNNPTDYWNIMNSRTTAGVPWTDPGTGNETNFLYSGDPVANTGTHEGGQGNVPGDRRLICTFDLDQLAFQDEVTIDFAVVFNDADSNNIQNVQGLKSVTDSIQAFFDNATFDCGQLGNVGLSELQEQHFDIYPNPSQGQFLVSFESLVSGTIELLDPAGRVVFSKEVEGAQEVNLSPNLPAGTYFVRLKTDDTLGLKKLIIR